MHEYRKIVLKAEAEAIWTMLQLYEFQLTTMCKALGVNNAFMSVKIKKLFGKSLRVMKKQYDRGLIPTKPEVRYANQTQRRKAANASTRKGRVSRG